MGFSDGAVFAVRPTEGAVCEFCHKPIMEDDLAVSGESIGLRHLGCIAGCGCPCHNITRARIFNCGCTEDHHSTDPRPPECCGKCPPLARGGYDCTCKGNPRCSPQPTDSES